MKKIIFGVQDPGGTNALLPVMKKINKEHYYHLEIKIMAAKYSKKILKQNNLPFMDCSNYNIQEIFKIIKNEMSDLIVTGTSYDFSLEDKLIYAAKKLNIKSISILDYWSNYWQRFSDLETGEKFKYVPDYIVIMDNLAKQEMLEEDFDENKLLVLGNPYFDELINNREKDSTVPSDRKKMVYVSSFINELFNGDEDKAREVFGYGDKEVFLDILDVLNEICFDGCQFELIIRPHPKENKDDYVPSKKLKYSYKIDVESESRELIRNNDILIGTCSIILFEAAMMGKTVISYQPNLKGKDYLISNRYGLTTSISDKEQLKTCLYEILLNKNYKSTKSVLNKIEPPILDGNSTKRVTEKILKMVGGLHFEEM